MASSRRLPAPWQSKPTGSFATARRALAARLVELGGSPAAASTLAYACVDPLDARVRALGHPDPGTPIRRPADR